MWLIICSFPFSKANWGWLVEGQQTGTTVAWHLKEVLDRFELTDSCLIGITTDNAFLNYSMTRELQSTLEDSGIEWPALRNHIPCMAHVIQLALGAFLSSLNLKAAQSLGKPMSAISNLERMGASRMGRVKDIEMRQVLKSIRCQPWDQV